jgi:4a-hydroxytetrahydrobiopterin dehydratase
LPFASIIVPTASRPHLLRRALAGVLVQSVDDWEVLVADDGESEGMDVARELGDPRIRALRSPGRGQVDARNAAIDAAHGDLVCWLDDDDWWDDREHLARLKEAADASDTRFFFRGGWIVHEENGRRDTFDFAATCRSLLHNNTVLTSSIAYPRRVHDTVGPLDRVVGGYCDWDFMVRLCRAGITPRKLAGLSVCYSVHGANVSADYDAPERRLGFDRFAAKHHLDIRIANHVTIRRMLADVPEGWTVVGDALEREFELESFPAAIEFVRRVGELAESENHHPDIDIRYRRVTLRWTTHDAGGITGRDRELAARSAELAG